MSLLVNDVVARWSWGSELLRKKSALIEQPQRMPLRRVAVTEAYAGGG